MRIGIVSLSYNRTAGISRCVVELTERLAKDHEIHVFANSWDGSSENKILFHKVPVCSNRWTLSTLCFFVMSGLLLRRHKFDIVHLHHPSLYSGDVVTCHGFARAGVRAGRRAQKAHGVKPDRKRERAFERIYPLLEYNFKKGRRKRIIVLSEMMKGEFTEFLGTPQVDMSVIPNGVDLDEFHPRNRLKYRSKIREKFNVKDSDFVFLFVGTFFGRKGLGFIIEALNEMRPENLKVLVVGHDTTDQVKYEGMVDEMELNDNILFAGHTGYAQQYYAASDAFVFPTIYEGFSLVILEAMASGLPVITSNVSGAPDLIRDGIDGILLRQPVVVDELIESMTRLVSDREVLNSFAREARKRVDEFSWEKFTQRTMKVYEEILDARTN